jgi:2-polyprenyl-3-methyl-5-hydroxy-6-metoxy-1,4-benzoquinol methylase
VTCPVCGATDLRETRVLDDLDVAVCRVCTLRVAHHHRERRTDAEYARVDPERYRNSIGRVREAQAQTIVERVRRFVANGVWLDVGAGFGYAVREAQRAGFDAHGVEPDADAAAAAGVTHGTLRDGSVERADVISTLDVLEHMSDLAAFAADVRDKLRSSGLWVIKVPTTEGVLFRVASLVRAKRALRRLWQCDEHDPHLVYFNRASLRRFLETNDFEVLDELPLAEVLPGTIVDRLTVDGAMPRWRALLAAPFIRALHAIGTSDALLVVARRTAKA